MVIWQAFVVQTGTEEDISFVISVTKLMIMGTAADIIGRVSLLNELGVWRWCNFERRTNTATKYLRVY